MLVRKNQKALTTTEKTAFVNAVLGLKRQASQMHPGDATRSRYDDFVEVHLNAMTAMMTPGKTTWGHQASPFTAWHRVLLFQFEQELRKIDGSVTLPYWDWTTDQAKTSAPWTNDFLGGDGRAGDGKVLTGPFRFDAGNWTIRVKDGPTDPGFLTRQMGRRADARRLPSKQAQKTCLATTPYDVAPWDDSKRSQSNRAQWQGFRIQLEIPLHNLVHRWVGGAMLAMASPNDPVFWLHHCNLDRLWSVWQRQNPTQAPYLPTSGGPTGFNLNDPLVFHEPGAPAPWAGSFKPAEVIDSHALGVAYDIDPAPAPPVAVVAVPTQPLPLFVLPAEIPALARSGGRGERGRTARGGTRPPR